MRRSDESEHVVGQLLLVRFHQVVVPGELWQLCLRGCGRHNCEHGKRLRDLCGAHFLLLVLLVHPTAVPAHVRCLLPFFVDHKHVCLAITIAIAIATVTAAITAVSSSSRRRHRRRHRADRSAQCET